LAHTAQRRSTFPVGCRIDITPDPSNSCIPFVEHRGSEADFITLRIMRDGGWFFPPVEM
jgi:hypothetical protein